jgi:Tol biopolymer transport system component/DNA-binding winged helix-turn-helix (wHTH) protein
MPPEVFEFGDVTVDLRKISVSRGGHAVPLEPKTFDVLCYLIEHRDRVVTKEELLDSVWKDTFVTPNVLTRAVAQLRKGLGDDAFEARYIETVAKRGYRFIAQTTGPRSHTTPHLSVVPPVPMQARRHRVSLVLVMAAVALLAAVGLAVFAFRDRDVSARATADASLSLRRFTTDSYSYSFPAISPDGRTVAYSSDQTGEMEIYTAGIAPGSTATAITTDGGHNMSADWSPDGQWIAYHSRKKGGVWIIPSSGGTARQIAEFGSQPAWMPDGQNVVFTSGSDGMAAQSVLWMVNRETGDRHQITKMGAPRGGHSKPSVSPDGRFVVFSVTEGHIKADVWIVPIGGGGNPEKLGPASAPSLSAASVPRFSPDGHGVYWVGRTPEGNDVLMRASIDDRGVLTGPPRTMQQFAGNFVGGFSIARDGTTVLSLFRGMANLWAVDVPADGQPKPPVPLTSDEVRNTQARHSGDGRIAFHQFAIGGPATVWVMNEDGKERSSLTIGLPYSVWGPQWLPDNARLLVVIASAARKPAFALLDVATRRLTSLALRADDVLSPHLSADGREIAFHLIDEGGVINVWTQPLEGGPRRQVTFDGEAMSYPLWSPDGKSIAVEIKRGDHTHIGVVPREGGSVEMLVTGAGQSWPNSWGPDNDRIAFAGERDGVWNIYTVSRTTKAVRQLTEFTSVEGYVRYPSWSRTRSAIVFERAEQRGSLWTMKLE